MTETNPDRLLHCIGGRPAPFDIKFDLKELLLCAGAAGEAFWALLTPGLAEQPPPSLAAAMEKLCHDYQLTPDRVSRAMRVCRLLFREAARRNVGPALMAQDLQTVAPRDAEALQRALLPRYEQLAPALRREVLYGALTDHGALLTGVTWRVDEMKLSQRGSDLQSAVALLTLTYVEGNQEKRVTLQALPDMIAQLRAMCEQVM